MYERIHQRYYCLASQKNIKTAIFYWLYDWIKKFSVITSEKSNLQLFHIKYLSFLMSCVLELMYLLYTDSSSFLHPNPSKLWTPQKIMCDINCT
jgi:hypothetical protein